MVDYIWYTNTLQNQWDSRSPHICLWFTMHSLVGASKITESTKPNWWTTNLLIHERDKSNRPTFLPEIFLLIRYSIYCTDWVLNGSDSHAPTYSKLHSYQNFPRQSNPTKQHYLCTWAVSLGVESTSVSYSLSSPYILGVAYALQSLVTCIVAY